jgi:site-specific recombinase XerC
MTTEIRRSETIDRVPVSTGDLLLAWADFLRLDVAQGDASPRTVATYQAQVRDFLAWCQAQGLHPALATEDDLKAYRAHLVERYARATVATRLAAIRRFYQAAVWRGYRTDNPAAGIRPPRERTARDERVRFLPLEGLKRLLDAPRGDGLRATRDRAILALMGVHGLRVGEIVALDVADLDLDAGTVSVPGKGGKRRTVYLVDISRQRLADWLAVRERVAGEGETALFVAAGPGKALHGPPDDPPGSGGADRPLPGAPGAEAGRDFLPQPAPQRGGVGPGLRCCGGRAGGYAGPRQRGHDPHLRPYREPDAGEPGPLPGSGLGRGGKRAGEGSGDLSLTFRKRGIM